MKNVDDDDGRGEIRTANVAGTAEGIVGHMHMLQPFPALTSREHLIVERFYWKVLRDKQR
jgi:hypothetical protein